MEPEGREERVRMEEGKRCSWPAAHTTSAADGWRLGVRTEEVRERVEERYKRETLMGLAQTELAQSEAAHLPIWCLIGQDTYSDDLSRLIDDKSRRSGFYSL